MNQYTVMFVDESGVERSAMYFAADLDECEQLFREDFGSLAIDYIEGPCDKDSDYDDSMDGDFDSAMASAGYGMDEDYGCYGE